MPMELTFKEIHGESRIRELLSEHSSLFPSLNSGQIEINELVEKLSNNARVIAAELGNSIIGFYAIYMNSQDKIAYLTLIGIDESYRGNGYGITLLSNAIGLANRGGYSVIKLEVNCNNAKAISLYKKLGFVFTDEPTGRNSKFMVRSDGLD